MGGIIGFYVVEGVLTLIERVGCCDTYSCPRYIYIVQYILVRYTVGAIHNHAHAIYCAIHIGALHIHAHTIPYAIHFGAIQCWCDTFMCTLYIMRYNGGAIHNHAHAI